MPNASTRLCTRVLTHAHTRTWSLPAFQHRRPTPYYPVGVDSATSRLAIAPLPRSAVRVAPDNAHEASSVRFTQWRQCGDCLVVED